MSGVHTYLLLEDGVTVLLYEDGVTGLLLDEQPAIGKVYMSATGIQPGTTLTGKTVGTVISHRKPGTDAEGSI